MATITSCAQKKTKKDKMNSQDTLTINNVAERMWQDMPKFDSHPMYLLRINQEYCTYEVLVNDFPIEKHYSRGKVATAIKINRAILKSGKQTVTIRMYPMGDLLQKAFGDDEPYMNTLYGGSSMSIEVVKVADWKNYSITDEETIKVHKTEGFDTNKFPGAGLPFYEFTFTFTAEVPYENEGWSNGINLQEIDSTILKKKILDYFKNYQKLYEEKDINKFIDINYNSELREAYSSYKSKEDINLIWEEANEVVAIDDKEFQPIKNYELVFYGEGKIATFKHSSHLAQDYRLRGQSGLYFLYDNQYYARFLGRYLYLPKEKYNGKDEDIKLEMIK